MAITRGEFIAAFGLLLSCMGGGYYLLHSDIADLRNSAKGDVNKSEEVDSRLGAFIVSTEKSVIKIEAGVSDLQNKFGGLAGQFKDLDTLLEKIDVRLTTMEVRIDTFSQQLQAYRRDPNFPQPIPVPQ